jgi:hypothetical protein
MRNDNRREPTPRELDRKRRKEQIQRRRLVLALCVLGLIIVIIVLVATCNSGGDKPTTTTTTTSGETTSTTLGAASYTADLTGANAVPAVDTTASGTFTMSYDPVNEELTYKLEVNGLTAPTAASIYVGAEGDSGTVVYTLLPDAPKAGALPVPLAQGLIDESSFTGPLEGKTLGDLINLIKEGNAYVSVGTAKHPIDAIRGQISLSADDTSTSDTAADTSSSDTTDTTG